MKTIVIANSNAILDKVAKSLKLQYQAEDIKTKEELRLDVLETIQPDFIFFLHWSWIIPENIYNKFNCVVFHMTDLPFGRGGSPLQNLIINGHTNTKISAIKVDRGIDTGDIYIKRDLSLEGKASEIFERTGEIIKEMIHEILYKDITPTKQTGEAVYFKRRKPEESVISSEIQDIGSLYNFIRMLDAVNYPHAFLETEKFKFEFTNAQIVSDKDLIANVRIIKK